MSFLPLSVGIMLPSRETAMTGKHHAQGLIAFAKTAEEAGFDSVWVGDSLLTRTGAEPLSMRIGSLTARPESVADQLLPALKEIGSP